MSTLNLPPFQRSGTPYAYGGAQPAPGPMYSPQTNTVQQGPVSAPSAPPQIPIDMSSPQSAYLPYGYSSGIPEFNPMIPGGGFYPELLGGQQQPQPKPEAAPAQMAPLYKSSTGQLSYSMYPTGDYTGSGDLNVAINPATGYPVGDIRNQRKARQGSLLELARSRLEK